MAQKTDTDIQELKDLITGLREETRLGFANIETKLTEIKGDIKLLDSRLVAVETSVTKLDTRLWAFGAIALSVTLGSILTIFVRFMLLNDPKF